MGGAWVTLVATLVALALAVRVIGLAERPLWLDEAYSAWFSAQSWHDLWVVVPRYETHPPFYYSLLKLWRGIAGADAGALRGLSVLFGLLTVVTVCLATRELEHMQPTERPLLRIAVAGVLATLAPYLIIMGQDARPYLALTFAYALAIYALLRLMRAFEDDKGPQAAGAVADWGLLAAGTILTLWLHGLGLLYAFCLFVTLLVAAMRQRVAMRWRRLAITVGVVAIAYAPCALMMFFRAGDWGSGWLRWDSETLVQLIQFYTVPLRPVPLAGFAAMLPLLLLALLGARGAVRRRERWSAGHALLLLWIGPPLLAAAASALVMPVFLLRTLTPTLIPAYLLFASALEALPRRAANALAWLLGIALAVNAGLVLRRPPAERWDVVSAYLARQVKPGDEVWLYPNDSALPLAAAARQAGHDYPVQPLPAAYPAVAVHGVIRAGSPAVPSLTPAQARLQAQRATALGTIWLVTRQSWIFDPNDDLPRALAVVRTAGRSREWGYIVVTPYARRAEVSRPAGLAGAALAH